MMDPAELQQQMMDKMLVGALEQVERAVDDELDRVENATVQQRSAARSLHISLHPSSITSMDSAPVMLSLLSAAHAHRAQEEDLAKIRANRVAEMKRKAEERAEQQRNGHGLLTKVNDQKEFFEYSKKSSRLVVLFTRDSIR
jgi:hypothetical protein